jgi:energy-coupling factor transporter ATP-binding protein EcfA2
MASSRQQPLIYFHSLELENVRCFGERQVFKLTDEQGRLAQWTLLLGDNGVGKTTLLQCLAWMKPVPTFSPKGSESGEGKPDTIEPWLNEAGNKDLNALLRVGTEVTLKLKATLSVGQALGVAKKTSPRIKTGLCLVGKNGQLQRRELTTNSCPPGFNKLYLSELPMFAYGAARRMGVANFDRGEFPDPLASLFSTATELYDAEEILLRLDYLAVRRRGSNKQRLDKVKEVLAAVLPHVENAKAIDIEGPKVPGKPEEPSGVRFVTPYGVVPLSGLSLGYQTTIAWITDLAIRLYDRYPDSPDPLAEPAIVLIDEIDLHLHPHWQRRLIEDLTPHFPKVQFIATAHSPLMVQATTAANLAVLQQKDGQVVIENEPYFVKNWRVDQILTSDLFGLASARNPCIEGLITERNNLLDKLKRTPKEEKRLRELEHELDNMPIAERREDQEAMDFIRHAAALLKRQDLHKR